jgi:hypothetical protein
VLAQDHFAVGALADDFRLSRTDTNFAGVGARFGVGLGHRTMLEAEMGYEFEQAFTEEFSNGAAISKYSPFAWTVWAQVFLGPF